MPRFRYLVAVAAAALVGCEGAQPTQPAAPDSPDVAVRTAARGTDGATSGGGKAMLPAGFSALSFSFGANNFADGRATGHFQQLYETASGTVDFAGKVTCVSVDAVNGRAWVGGVITRNSSTHPSMNAAIHQVGRDVWFRVLDGGEGRNANPDRTTVFGFEGAAGFITSADYCAGQPWAANDANTWEVITGNIQVRP